MILVTGATGFVGGRLVPALGAAGHEATALVRDASRYGAPTGVRVAEDDLLEPAALRDEFGDVDARLENNVSGIEVIKTEHAERHEAERIAIARAFLKGPAILVLDEATSHVDTETDAPIQASLAEFARDRTTVVVAHRLSTVRPADTILVLDEGGVVERGSHEELIEADGLYANFWRVQAGDFDHLPPEFLERARDRQAAVESGEEWHW